MYHLLCCYCCMTGWITAITDSSVSLYTDQETLIRRESSVEQFEVFSRHSYYRTALLPPSAPLPDQRRALLLLSMSRRRKRAMMSNRRSVVWLGEVLDERKDLLRDGDPTGSHCSLHCSRAL